MTDQPESKSSDVPPEGEIVSGTEINEQEADGKIVADMTVENEVDEEDRRLDELEDAVIAEDSTPTEAQYVEYQYLILAYSFDEMPDEFTIESLAADTDADPEGFRREFEHYGGTIES
ncbi:hypothetical protein [Haloarcula amylolytica]|uniref:Uncharacterized protein n=1 Tax=Haloarcula amylolytica JCM 13557 TaxID=1227452 RepID=M0JZ13_9EURY|nr:hypothetical protein [Haloarcula amylolytica]EMA14221.1 hypothetical protein C442_20416 [Haloarcula amylolytica JCM 13557]